MAIYELLDSKDLGTFYIDPNDVPGVKRRNHPKIVLFFQEDYNLWKERCRLAGKTVNRGSGEMSFRLMHFNSTTITNSKLTMIGELAKAQFGGNNGYVWDKGKILYSYSDWDNGCQFQVLSRTKTQAKTLITKALHLNELVFDNKKFNTVAPEEPLLKYPPHPPSRTILGQSFPQDEQRPNVSVRFRHISCHIEGLMSPKYLYSLSASIKNPLVK